MNVAQLSWLRFTDDEMLNHRKDDAASAEPCEDFTVRAAINTGLSLLVNRVESTCLAF